MYLYSCLFAFPQACWEPSCARQKKSSIASRSYIHACLGSLNAFASPRCSLKLVGARSLAFQFDSTRQQFDCQACKVKPTAMDCKAWAASASCRWAGPCLLGCERQEFEKSRSQALLQAAHALGDVDLAGKACWPERAKPHSMKRKVTHENDSGLQS